MNCVMPRWISVISGAGVVIFGAQNNQLAGLVAPFWHPGESLWHFGGALGGHRSSRKDILGSRVGFPWILGGFWDPILRVFLILWSNTGVFCLCFFPGYFLMLFWYDSGRMEFGKQAFGIKGCAKTNLSQISRFC